jgi:hypothetical protein
MNEGLSQSEISPAQYYSQHPYKGENHEAISDADIEDASYLSLNKQVVAAQIVAHNL